VLYFSFLDPYDLATKSSSVKLSGVYNFQLYTSNGDVFSNIREYMNIFSIS